MRPKKRGIKEQIEHKWRSKQTPGGSQMRNGDYKTSIIRENDKRVKSGKNEKRGKSAKNTNQEKVKGGKGGWRLLK